MRGQVLDEKGNDILTHAPPVHDFAPFHDIDPDDVVEPTGLQWVLVTIAVALVVGAVMYVLFWL